MAMNRIPGNNIYVGGVLSLKNKAALNKANITHVVTVLRMSPPVVKDEYLESLQRLYIDVDDVDDENLLQHFSTATKFIQSGLDNGGSVLIHCAMGKSRSATVAIAYLLHRQPDTMTPQGALAIIRESRPLCEPNDGFMEQLNIYHQMGCPDDVIGHPLYNRWMYRREVEDSVACGRAPEMSSVLFEDTQPHQQEESGPSTEIKCRKCRRMLANTRFIIPHEEERKIQLREKGHSPVGNECAHVFLHPLTWMRPSLFPKSTGSDESRESAYGAHPDDAPLSGRLTCPNTACAQNIGKFAWQGMQCSCGSWVVPAIGLAKARVDVVKRSPLAARSPVAALGIRLPPGMRPGADGRGNNL